MPNAYGSLEPRLLAEFAVGSALRALVELQADLDSSTDLAPGFEEKYRRFVMATSEYYLLFLASLFDAAADEGGTPVS